MVQILTHDLDTDNSVGFRPGSQDAGFDDPVFRPDAAVTGAWLGAAAVGDWRRDGRWNGTAFAPNGSDSCTRLPVANQGLRDYARNLNAGETAVTSGALAIAAGKGRIVLSAPGCEQRQRQRLGRPEYRRGHRSLRPLAGIARRGRCDPDEIRQPALGDGHFRGFQGAMDRHARELLLLSVFCRLLE